MNYLEILTQIQTIKVIIEMDKKVIILKIILERDRIKKIL